VVTAVTAVSPVVAEEFAVKDNLAMTPEGVVEAQAELFASFGPEQIVNFHLLMLAHRKEK